MSTERETPLTDEVLARLEKCEHSTDVPTRYIRIMAAELRRLLAADAKYEQRSMMIEDLCAQVASLTAKLNKLESQQGSMPEPVGELKTWEIADEVISLCKRLCVKPHVIEQLHALFLGHEAMRARVPDGWMFLCADFSMQAYGNRDYGNVTLIKDEAGRKNWHALSEEEQKRAPLYVHGIGRTINEAIADAARDAAAPKPDRDSVSRDTKV